jgi:capsular polysaccharide biosynthesis protein
VPATRFWIDRVRSRSGLPPPHPSRKLYLSRRGIGGTRILTNAATIEQMAERSGFEMVFPETLSFIDQVRLFGQASQIVGEYGSALHNVIFSAPAVPVCALRGILREPSCLQTGIGAAMGAPTGYVFGQTEGEGFTHRFTVDVSDFLRALEITALAASRLT